MGWFLIAHDTINVDLIKETTDTLRIFKADGVSRITFKDVVTYHKGYSKDNKVLSLINPTALINVCKKLLSFAQEITANKIMAT